MKKITTTLVASFAMLALACPLYAADDKGSTADSQSREGGSQPGPGQQAGAMNTRDQPAGARQSAPGQQAGVSKSQSAQKTEASSTQMTGVSQSQSAEKNLKGYDVFTQSGEKIGKISEVRTDKQSGQVQFVTLTKGGVMGMGGNDTIVPLGAIKLDRQNERATLTVSEDKLKNGPAQAGKSDQDFQRELSSHYGIAPDWDKTSKTEETRVPDPSPGLETGSPQSRGNSN